MSSKTEQKRQLILDRAVDVFAEKGYKAVTMKDLVDAAEISRGGLYLYFSSVEEVFLEVLENNDRKNDEELSKEQLQGASNTEMLLYFLKLQKKQILNRKRSLLLAKLEYRFQCKQDSRTCVLKEEIDAEKLILQKLLERGNKNGEFRCLNPKEEASNIIYALEGMKLTACTLGISEKKVDTEFLHLMRNFVPVTE